MVWTAQIETWIFFVGDLLRPRGYAIDLPERYIGLGVCAAGVFTKGDRCRCRVRRYVGNGIMSFERGHRGRQSC